MDTTMCVPFVFEVPGASVVVLTVLIVHVQYLEPVRCGVKLALYVQRARKNSKEMV